MKKCLSLVSLLLAVLFLCSCGSPAASGTDASSEPVVSSGPYGSDADYKAVIEAARDPELNDLALYDIVTSSGDSLYEAFFSGTFGLVEDDYERYAISAGTIITIAYGVMIILPKEGRHDAVMAQVQGYVEQQQKAMENYLQDQYEIAKGAVIKTAATGEVMLAMCKDAEAVMAKMEEGLAQ